MEDPHREKGENKLELKTHIQTERRKETENGRST
jgi:hypothetical protein